MEKRKKKKTAVASSVAGTKMPASARKRMLAKKTKADKRQPSSSDSPGGAARKPRLFVAIGASAGGLEAIESFFKAMPPDSGMAFFVVQHLSPEYKSLMVEILAKHTEMPVLRVENGMVAQPDHVYLIPPATAMTIFHGKLILTPYDHHKGLNLPIDIFMRSLADDQGDKTVAIILSGTGSDGARGVRAVKAAGGLVLAQSEESAKFDGMPRSAIATGSVDFILAPELMPARLLEYVRYPHAARVQRSTVILSDEDNLARVFALLREAYKTDFTYYKPSTVVRRIERRMTVTQAADLREYVAVLERAPGELATLHRDLLIGVTSFFRDREVFEELRARVLPGLLVGEEEIRLWVAGCSTGEEAYTLAMLCSETLAQAGRRVPVKIFATDIDGDAIHLAGIGTYPESIIADLPQQFVAKYFTHREGRYQVVRALREMVVFARHNLIKDPPFTNIRLISCRNLLIYLQPGVQRKVLELFNFSLQPGGVLLLGTSETVGDMESYFAPLNQKFRIYRSTGKRLPGAAPGEVRLPLSTQSYPGMTHLPRRENSAYWEQRVLERLLDCVVGEHLRLALVVDEARTILHTAGTPDGLLQFPTGKAVNDITRVIVRELAVPVASGLQRALGQQPEAMVATVRVGQETLQVRTLPLPGRRGQPPLAAVLIGEARRDAPSAGASPVAYDVSRDAAQRISELEQELQFSRENLQATIEELETSNEELQATNEELLASNEELQSTNEELQSVNEELYTVNAEHQKKIQEATELTADLDNLLSSSRILTLFLDENLEVRRFTPALTAVFGIIPGDVGRPLSQLTHNLVDTDIVALAREVLETRRLVEREVVTERGEWYLLRVVPYQVSGSTTAGVVLTLVDISMLVNQRAEQGILVDRFSNLLELLPLGVWFLDAQQRTTVANRAFELLLGCARGEMLGRHFTEFVTASELATARHLADDWRAGKRSVFDLTLRRADGRACPARLTAAPYSGSDGKHAGTVLIINGTRCQVGEQNDDGND